MKKAIKIGLTCALFSATVFGTTITTLPTNEAEAASVYSSCKVFNSKYKSGVRKSANTKNKVIKRNGTVTYKSSYALVSPSIYNAAMKANHDLDRDKDGIACEK